MLYNVLEMLGRKIKELRLQMDLNQETLAEKAGISPTTLGHIETGRTLNPEKQTIERIAGALDIDVETLLKGPVKEDEMGRAVPGGRQFPAGYGVKQALPPDRERLAALQKALAIICTMEQRGEATVEERDSLTNVVARLEQAE